MNDSNKLAPAAANQAKMAVTHERWKKKFKRLKKRRDLAARAVEELDAQLSLMKDSEPEGPELLDSDDTDVEETVHVPIQQPPVRRASILFRFPAEIRIIIWDLLVDELIGEPGNGFEKATRQWKKFVDKKPHLRHVRSSHGSIAFLQVSFAHAPLRYYEAGARLYSRPLVFNTFERFLDVLRLMPRMFHSNLRRLHIDIDGGKQKRGREAGATYSHKGDFNVFDNYSDWHVLLKEEYQQAFSHWFDAVKQSKTNIFLQLDDSCERSKIRSRAIRWRAFVLLSPGLPKVDRIFEKIPGWKRQMLDMKRPGPNTQPVMEYNKQTVKCVSFI